MRNVRVLWGIIVVLSLCVAALASVLLFRPSAAPAEGSIPKQAIDAPRTVASIGGRVITESEVKMNLVRRYGQTMMKEMLDREAVRLEAEQKGIKVADSEVDMELKRMQQGYDNEDAFYKSMKEQLGLTKSELREDVYNKLLLDKIATQNIKVSDQDITDYMNSHPEEFTGLVQIRIQQLILNNKETAVKAIEELKKGTDFAIVARDRSLDDATANKGGDLGWVDQGDPFVPAPIMNEAKNLQAGQISAPIPLDKGQYAVIRLKERKEKGKDFVDMIREGVRRDLALHQAPPLKDILSSLRAKRNASIVDPAYSP